MPVTAGSSKGQYGNGAVHYIMYRENATRHVAYKEMYQAGRVNAAAHSIYAEQTGTEEGQG